MEMLADDVAASMHTIGVERAHVSGVSFGAATGLWLAGKYPQRVKLLAAQLLDENRSIPQGGGRRLAEYCKETRVLQE